MSNFADAQRDVSRETIEKLESFQRLLLKWNPSINLVAKPSVEDFWERHIVDSMQIFRFADKSTRSWVDIGSGGGLPGLVVAVMALEKMPNMRTTLIESDKRKSVFLRTVVRELELNAEVVSERIENVSLDTVDIISARALASLNDLFSMCAGLINPDTKMVFLKGRRFGEEIETARLHWGFDVVAHQSITDSESKLLEIGDLKRAR